MKKKLLVLMVILALVLLCGCGGNETNSEGGTESTDLPGEDSKSEVIFDGQFEMPFSDIAEAYKVNLLEDYSLGEPTNDTTLGHVAYPILVKGQDGDIIFSSDKNELSETPRSLLIKGPNNNATFVCDCAARFLRTLKPDLTEDDANQTIIDLISNGVRGIHIYTMNKPEIARAIIHNVDDIIKAINN